jgi:hypothetical protein
MDSSGKPQTGPVQASLIRPWTAWLRQPSNAVLVGVLLVNAVLILYTAIVTLQRFPNSGDEYAYLISAELFTQGRLSAPSPRQPRFFDVNHILNDGKFYGKYPPGWPAMLAPAVAVGLPWLTNPILGLGTLVLLYLVARKHFSERAAVYAAVTLLANPFFIFNSASYYSHTSCLFFVMLAVYAFLNWREEPSSWRQALLMGTGAGMAFLIRPFSAVLVLLPLALGVMWVTWNHRKERSVLGAFTAGTAPLLIAAGAYLLYNYRLTGDPLLQPFTKYDPLDRPHRPPSLAELWSWFSRYPGARALELNWPWLPFCFVHLLWFWINPATRRDPKAQILFASAAMLFVGYSFYPADGGLGYGPRYQYESLAGMVFLMGVACASLPRIAPYAAAAVMAVNCMVFVSFTNLTARDIEEKQDLRKIVEREKLADAIVFLKNGPGTAHPGDMTRNGLRFDGPVLYVRDRGSDNRLLVREHRHRKAYVYTFDPQTKRGQLTPYADSP